MTIALALLLAASLPDELKTASDALWAAVESADAEKAAAAAQTLGKIGSRAAAEALLRSLSKAVKGAADAEGDLEKLKGGGKPSAEYNVLLKEFTDRLGKLNVIAFAISRALSQVRAADGVQELVRRLKGDADPQVRSRLAEALRSADHADVLPALIDRLSYDKDASVVIPVLEALAAKRPRDPDVLAKIAAKLQDPAWQVAVTAARALGAIRSLDSVDPLIEALRKAEGRVRFDLNAALVAVTGVDKHGEPAAWKDWWDRNREAVAAGTYKPEPAERPQGGAGGTTFYGIPVVSKRPIFIIDASMSMNKPSDWKPADEKNLPGGLAIAGDRKIDVAKFELKKVLLMMPDGAEFNIVFFNRSVEAFSPAMVKLDKDSRQKAIEWIDALQLVLQTNIWEGMAKGFTFATDPAPRKPRDTVVSGGDTIYLLSDGLPTTGIKDPDEFCRGIAELNRTKKLVVHTVAIEPTKRSGAFMERLARENGGQYGARGAAGKPKP